MGIGGRAASFLRSWARVPLSDRIQSEFCRKIEGVTFRYLVRLDLPDDHHRAGRPDELGEYIRISFADLGARFGERSGGARCLVVRLVDELPEPAAVAPVAFVCRACGRRAVSVLDALCDACYDLAEGGAPSWVSPGKPARRWLMRPRWLWGDKPLYVVVLLAVTYGTAVAVFKLFKWLKN